MKLHSGIIEQLGHPINCELPECSSPLRVIRAALPHFPVLRAFTRLLYKARKCHMNVLAIDSALSYGSIDKLIPFLGLKENLSDLFSVDGVEHPVVSEDHSSSGLGCIERGLKVTHADLITELQSKFNDDAEYFCKSTCYSHHKVLLLSHLCKNSAHTHNLQTLSTDITHLKTYPYQSTWCHVIPDLHAVM